MCAAAQFYPKATVSDDSRNLFSLVRNRSYGMRALKDVTLTDNNW